MENTTAPAHRPMVTTKGAAHFDAWVNAPGDDTPHWVGIYRTFESAMEVAKLVADGRNRPVPANRYQARMFEQARRDAIRSELAAVRTRTAR